MMNKTEKFWDKQAKGYDNQISSSSPAHIKTVEATKKHLNSGDVVLDFACGTGTMSIEIAPHVQTIHAIDLSSEMIAIAKRKAGEGNITNIQFAQGTLFDAHLQDESFDGILALNVLHLLEETPKVLQRINGLLKPGGYFISSTACMGAKSFWGVALSLFSKIGLVPYLNTFTIAELENIITDADFHIVEADMFRVKPPNRFIVARKQ